jgi:hypothetical protein
MAAEKKDSGYPGRGQRYEKVHYGVSSRRRMSAFELMKFLKKTPPPAKAEGPVRAEEPKITEV